MPNDSEVDEDNEVDKYETGFDDNEVDKYELDLTSLNLKTLDMDM